MTYEPPLGPSLTTVGEFPQDANLQRTTKDPYSTPTRRQRLEHARDDRYGPEHRHEVPLLHRQAPLRELAPLRGRVRHRELQHRRPGRHLPRLAHREEGPRPQRVGSRLEPG